jgi:hypothetical protein
MRGRGGGGSGAGVTIQTTTSTAGKSRPKTRRNRLARKRFIGVSYTLAKKNNYGQQKALKPLEVYCLCINSLRAEFGNNKTLNRL